MELFDIYIDDDMTGTNYDRPDFQRMMADVRRKKINLVIVKDLSRLGRNYVETGELLEMTFPMLNVRVISITDNYDSDKGVGGLSVAITNMVNDFYAKDISKKVYTSKHSLMNKGIPTAAIPFGYKAVYDESGTRTMIINDEPAETVRLIFKMFIEGHTTKEIAEYLNANGCLTPYLYRYRNKPEKLAEKPHLRWTIATVISILINDVYTGKYTSKKRERAYFRNENEHSNPQEKWLVFENHHAAIISKEDYEKAVELRKTKYNTSAKHKVKKFKPINLLKGKIFCKCGAAYNIRYKTLQCYRNQRYGADICNNERIIADELYDMILSVIQEKITFLLEEDKVIKALNRTSDTRIRKNKLITAQSEKQRAIRHIYTLKSELYSDYTNGILSEQEYIALNREYSDKI